MNTRFYNRTRTSRSITRRLLKEHKFYLLPLYYILLSSYLAEEAIKNSGSHQLADHIYKSKARGKFIVGKLIDYILLSLPSSKSFRNRYLFSKKELLKEIHNNKSNRKLRVLSVPCGIPRDLIDVGVSLKETNLLKERPIEFLGLDLSDIAISDAKREVNKHLLDPHFQFIQADAFSIEHYPKDIDYVISTGLGEFLTDEELVMFYKIIYDVLNPDGTFYTSAIDKHPVSDYLLREIGEIYTNYRSYAHVKKIISQVGFKDINLYEDKYGLQTIIIARK